MPYVTWATDNVPTAAQLNANFRDQVVTTCTSATRPSGTQGQVIYETDTSKLYCYTGSAWELLAKQGAWTSYTPTVAQGATTNITKTVNYAKYSLFGTTCHVNGALSMTGAGTGAAAITITMPVAAASNQNQTMGAALFYDASGVTRYCGMAEMLSTTTFGIATDITTNVTIGAAGFTGAIASGDVIRYQLTYEVA